MMFSSILWLNLVVIFCKFKENAGCAVQLRELNITKNLLKKANEEFLAANDDVYGRSLPWNKLRPQVLCRPCEWQLNNFRAFRALLTESQNHLKGAKEWKYLLNT